MKAGLGSYSEASVKRAADRPGDLLTGRAKLNLSAKPIPAPGPLRFASRALRWGLFEFRLGRVGPPPGTRGCPTGRDFSFLATFAAPMAIGLLNQPVVGRTAR